jgi:alkylated DNA nucleotide flippase Atl1
VIGRFELSPGDRVLFLHIPGAELLEAVAQKVEFGPVVCIGNLDEVAGARRAFLHLDNVMFHAAALDELPWQESYFSRVIDLRGGWQSPALAAREVMRVTGSGGLAFVASSEAALLGELGMLVVSSGDGHWRCART